jgi:hypothetical protein
MASNLSITAVSNIPERFTRLFLHVAASVLIAGLPYSGSCQTASPGLTDQASPAAPANAQWKWNQVPGDKNTKAAQLASIDGGAQLEVFVYKGQFGSCMIAVPGPLEMKDHSKAIANQMSHNKTNVELKFDDQKQISAPFFITRFPWDDSTPVIAQNDHGDALFNQSMISKTMTVSLVDDSGKTYTAQFDLTTMPTEMAAHKVSSKKKDRSGWITAIAGAAGVL